VLTRARRIAVVSIALIVTSLGILALTVGAPPAGAASGPTAALAQQSDGEGGGAPSIIPDPNDRGTNNIGGLIVGTVLLGGWLGAGSVMFVRARRRRAAARLAATAAA
jgi:hypothetical protein